MRRRTWLKDLPPGAADWERLVASSPGFFAAWSALEDELWRSVDPTILRLCRARMAILLGVPGQRALTRDEKRDVSSLTRQKLAALAQWPYSPLFAPVERTCLSFAEQFVLDVTGIDQSMVDALLEHLSPADCYSFTYALWCFEAMERVCLVLDVELPPTAAAVHRAELSG